VENPGLIFPPTVTIKTSYKNVTRSQLCSAPRRADAPEAAKRLETSSLTKRENLSFITLSFPTVNVLQHRETAPQHGP
jgi:hypothetical protein